MWTCASNTVDAVHRMRPVSHFLELSSKFLGIFEELPFLPQKPILKSLQFLFQLFLGRGSSNYTIVLMSVM